MAGRIQPIKWQESAEELCIHYRGEPDLARRKRLQVLWQVRRGVPAHEAAQEAGVGVRTVTRWLDWYRQDGLAAVLRRVPGHGARGSAGRLTPEQTAQLLEQTRQGRFRTYDDARQWVAETLDVHYSYQGMYSVLARLSVHPKVPRPMAEKADAAAQASWKRGA